MVKWSIFGVSGLALLAVTGTALADVTPEDVWQNWQDIAASSGQTIIADSVVRDGDTLVVSNITMTSATPDITINSSTAELRLTDAGDGTVLIQMPAEYPMNMTVPAGPNRPQPVQIALTILQEGATLTASGDPAAVTYDLTAPTMKIKLNSMDGVAAQNLTVEATMADIKGKYTIDDTETIVSDVTVGGVALAVVGSDATGEARMTSAIKDLTVTSSGAMLGAMGGADFLTALDAGSNTASRITYGSADFDIEVTAPEGPSSLKGSSEAGMISVQLGAAGLDYAISQKGLLATVTSAEIPFPNIALQFEELAFGLKLPLVPSNESQPFAFQTKLTNMDLSDEIWAIFDPMAALPRDPITLVIDTEGLMKVTKAMTPNPEIPSQIPAELDSMTLKELQLSVAGAELTGTGTGKMDYPTAGDPVPSGKFDLKLTGANALLDRLVAAGFLAAEDLMMPRMMLAMVGVPDPAGGDSLLSKIEIRDKGVFANGQKLYDIP